MLRSLASPACPPVRLSACPPARPAPPRVEKGRGVCIRLFIWPCCVVLQPAQSGMALSGRANVSRLLLSAQPLSTTRRVQHILSSHCRCVSTPYTVKHSPPRTRCPWPRGGACRLGASPPPMCRPLCAFISSNRPHSSRPLPQPCHPCALVLNTMPYHRNPN